MANTRRVKIREVPGMDCWCACQVDEDGYETSVVATGFCREVVIKIVAEKIPYFNEIIFEDMKTWDQSHE